MNTVLIATEVNEPKRPKAPDKRTGMRKPKLSAFYEERLLRKMEGKSEAEKLKMRKQFDQSKQRHARRKAKEMMALEKFERIFPDVKQSELLKVSGLNLASMPDPE